MGGKMGGGSSTCMATKMRDVAGLPRPVAVMLTQSLLPTRPVSVMPTNRPIIMHPLKRICTKARVSAPRIGAPHACRHACRHERL